LRHGGHATARPAARKVRGVSEEDAHFRMGEVSLRWIYVHMIEETARHPGHADILREQLDGTAGS
jgi:Protein of unknown function (DUF664)